MMRNRSCLIEISVKCRLRIIVLKASLELGTRFTSYWKDVTNWRRLTMVQLSRIDRNSVLLLIFRKHSLNYLFGFTRFPLFKLTFLLWWIIRLQSCLNILKFFSRNSLKQVLFDRYAFGEVQSFFVLKILVVLLICSQLVNESLLVSCDWERWIEATVWRWNVRVTTGSIFVILNIFRRECLVIINSCAMCFDVSKSSFKRLKIWMMHYVVPSVIQWNISVST